MFDSSADYFSVLLILELDIARFFIEVSFIVSVDG